MSNERLQRILTKLKNLGLDPSAELQTRFEMLSMSMKSHQPFFSETMSFLAEVEAEYGIEISDLELEEIDTVGDLVKIVDEKAVPCD